MHHAVLDRTQIDLTTREAVHDLRNLFGIVASARHLLSDTMTDERRRVVLDAIEGAAIRGGQLTTQLLATHGSVASVFDLSDHLRALEPMLRAIAGSRVALRYDLATPGAAVNVDPNALEATVLEMVTNARAACHADGTIILRTRSIGGRLWLTVADDGQGMDRDTLRACLAARAPGAHGSGLGRIRQFARHAHARFHIRSRANRGTVISLNMPAAATKAPTRPSVPPIGQSDRKPRKMP